MFKDTIININKQTHHTQINTNNHSNTNTHWHTHTKTQTQLETQSGINKDKEIQRN